MSEAREKALLVLGDGMVLDVNQVKLAIGAMVYLDDGSYFNIGEDAVRRVCKWVNGDNGDEGDEGEAGDEGNGDTVDEDGEVDEELLAPAEAKKKRATPEEVAQWVEWKKAGMKTAEIAAKAQRPYPMVYRLLRECQG